MADDQNLSDTLAVRPMSGLQIAAVATLIGLLALDGFDVLSISFAAPGIALDWGIDRAALGIVLSAELIGMAVGSLVSGFVADRIGRRKTLLPSLCLMAVAMCMVTTANGIGSLAIWRVITGIGIGGVMATASTLVAEFSNRRRRDLCMSLMVVGYPIGVIVGGLICAQLLKTNGWHSVFYVGAGMTAAFIPITAAWVPESVSWLLRTRPVNALASINRTLLRMGYVVLQALPQSSAPSGAESSSRRKIFSRGLLAVTVTVSAAYFFHAIAFYYTMKWIPKIVVDMGFAASSAAGVLVWANVGGAIGGVTFGLLSQRVDPRRLTVGVMLASTAMIFIFGRAEANLRALALICACTGFFTNGAIAGIYALMARGFPTHVRASGIGFAIGVGRGGAMLGPVLAGYLFRSGLNLAAVSAIIALSSTFAALVLLLLKIEPESAKRAEVAA
jgi:MFS transporter, AAHS family, vanillate permease